MGKNTEMRDYLIMISDLLDFYQKGNAFFISSIILNDSQEKFKQETFLEG